MADIWTPRPGRQDPWLPARQERQDLELPARPGRQDPGLQARQERSETLGGGLVSLGAPGALLRPSATFWGAFVAWADGVEGVETVLSALQNGRRAPLLALEDLR